MHKNIILLFFISFFTQAFELPEDTLSHIFLCVDYTTKKKLKITCRVFYNIFKKNLYLLTVDFCEGLDINDYIDLLYLNVNNNSFIDHELDYDKMNAFDYKTVCAIVPCGNGLGMNRTILKVGQKYLKFFFPYGRIIVALKAFIHGHYEKFLKNCIVKKIVKDICIFCDSEYCEKENLSQNYFIGILNNIKQKSLEEKETLLKKALVEKNFSNIVFLLYIINNCNMPEIRYYYCSENSFYNNHSITGSNRLYNALNHEQRMLLARANCSMFIGSRIIDGLYGKGKLHKNITSFMRAVENKHMVVAESLLEIMVEQGYDFSSRGHSIDQLVTVNGSVCKETIGLIPYLLNNNACNIVEILIKNKFKLFSSCMNGATSDQIKTIVNIYCKIFSDPWDQMKNCFFLHNAVGEGDLDLVKFLLDKGADINQLICTTSGIQPIAYALKNEQMCDFFIENKKRLNLNFEYGYCIAFGFRSCMDFWLDPDVEKNVMKMLDKGVFTESSLFSFICRAIEEKKRFNLCKYALNEYKKLNNDKDQKIFDKAIIKENKEIISFLLQSDFNIDLLNKKSEYAFYYNGGHISTKNYEYKVNRIISLIDDSLLISSYKKNKKDMNRGDWFLWVKCAEGVQKLDFVHFLLNNSDVGLKKLIAESPLSRTIEERINIEDRINNGLKQRKIKKDFCHLINKEQKHLRLRE